MILNANSLKARQVYETGYRGNQRYVRIALANFGTTSRRHADETWIAILGRPRTSPINT